MDPGTEFARDLCAGIGPLQLGVVLVMNIFSVVYIVVYFGPVNKREFIQ